MIARNRSQSSNPRRLVYGRLAWLDELRFVAIALMIVDHGCLFFAPTNTIAEVLRCTLTRCAEPLFVFVLTSAAVFLRRALRPSRLLQIFGLSLATSWLFSVHLGYAVADVLVSLSVVIVALPLLTKMCDHLLIGVLYVTAALCVVPVSLGSVAFDYSPMLLVYQVLLTRLLLEKSGRVAGRHGVLSGCVVLLAAWWVYRSGGEITGSTYTICFGHPLAALVIFSIRGADDHRATLATFVARYPLTIYACHLAVFATLARFSELRGSL
ncbi:MAG: hypothetical protein ACI8UO_006313 [Verrucomicrobiales bacterium]|jgi:hypothetical protein